MAFDETATTVIKWIFIVFAAGFVGYFGKYLGIQIIEKLRGKKAKSGTKRPLSKAEVKLEKKKAKAEKKRIKALKK